MTKSLARTLPVTAVLLLAACGLPKPPDIRGRTADSVTQLGLRPIFPFSETMRLGAVLLVDESIAKPDSLAPSHQETSLLITEDLVPAFETARRQRFTVRAANRFQASSGDLLGSLRPATTGNSFYRQGTVSTDARTVNEGTPTLAALPGYTLASVDQYTLAGLVPGTVASFFAALGLRHTSYLQMQAEGVEVAELPFVDLIDTLEQACRALAAGSRGLRYVRAVNFAYDTFAAQREDRLRNRLEPSAPVNPIFAVPRRVFYMRGVRFVIDDSRAAAAFAQAAVRNPLPTGASAVPLPAVSINANLAPPSNANAPGEAANAARITALQQQIDQLRSVLGNGSNVQFAGSVARATATGVELVQLFDRPLAFGYQAFFVPAGVARVKGEDGKERTESQGLAPICE